MFCGIGADDGSVCSKDGVPLADPLGVPLGVAEGVPLGVADSGVGLGVGLDEMLGEAVPPGWPVREMTTPAATAAPSSTTAPAMIRISRPWEPNGPEPWPDAGG